MQNLVRVSKANEKNLPFKPATFYKWHHLKKFPELFVRISGSLFVDLDRLAALIEQGRGRREG
jgi:hypothetical protein